LVTAASGGSLLFDQYRAFAILKPKNRNCPPQRGRDLNSKTINQTAALPIQLHAPAHFATGVSKGGERGRDRPKERGGSLPVQVSILLCRVNHRGLCRRCRYRLQNTEGSPILGPRRHCYHCHQNAEKGPVLGPRLLLLGLRVVPGAVTAASRGSLLYDQCVPFAILKPKNRKAEQNRA
jgi:hypothetical protein